MGGRDKVLAAANEAMDKKEYSWAAHLVNYLYQLDRTDEDARKIKAEALRQMAYVSTGSNNRAHLMSQALALEGKVTIPTVIPPAPETIKAFPGTFVDYFRIRINPVKSGETNELLQFDFDDGTSVGLHVRRAVAEFIENLESYPSEADHVLKLSGEAWAKVYLSAGPIQDLMDNGEIKVIKGDAKEVVRVLELFDRYDPESAVIIPSTLVQDHK